MSGWQRSRAMLHVTSHLGANVLMASDLSGHEAISQPYDFHVTLLSERHNIDPDEMLHQGLSVALQHDGTPIRHFHGLVQSFATDGRIDGRDLTRYQARLVPGHWFMSQTVDCRIFQKKSVTEIVRTVIQEAGLQSPEFKLQEPHKPREYITQFNETDLQFIARLLQEEGAFYFFEHAQGEHRLVISDHNGAFRPLPDGTVRFDSAVDADDVLTGWKHATGTTHGQVRLIDYDPSTPKKRLDAQQQTVLTAGGAKSRDIFRWPALTHEPGVVKSRAKFYLEADEAAVALIHGEGRARAFVPAASFTLAEDPHDGAKGKNLVLQAVSHEAWDHTVLGGDGGIGYRNHFSAFPLTVPWREPFSVPRPRMDGVHAAIVIGPKGVEIHTDDLGRVKVMFFWDHRKEAHPDHAIWARVVYPWAGGGWGWQSTPRVGTEVVIAFMDGDPDRPIVLGGVYNGDDKPIYTEAQKTKSGIRTRSSLSGAASNFNELTFDDKKDSELIYVQAEKDMETLVKHDQTLTVNHCRMKYVKVNETVRIGNHQSLKIGNGRDTTISKADDTLTISKGDMTIEVSMGKIEITAMQSIELKVGQTSVKLDQTGVTVKGMLLDFTGEAMMTTKAPLTQMTADGMMILKAGLMTLN